MLKNFAGSKCAKLLKQASNFGAGDGTQTRDLCLGNPDLSLALI
jgi:hypothetical protein